MINQRLYDVLDRLYIACGDNDVLEVGGQPLREAWDAAGTLLDETDQTANTLSVVLEQIIWKLNHNFDLPGYKGPAYITREDTTIRRAQKVLNSLKGD